MLTFFERLVFSLAVVLFSSFVFGAEATINLATEDQSNPASAYLEREIESHRYDTLQIFNVSERGANVISEIVADPSDQGLPHPSCEFSRHVWKDENGNPTDNIAVMIDVKYSKRNHSFPDSMVNKENVFENASLGRAGIEMVMRSKTKKNGTLWTTWISGTFFIPKTSFPLSDGDVESPQDKWSNHSLNFNKDTLNYIDSQDAGNGQKVCTIIQARTDQNLVHTDVIKIKRSGIIPKEKSCTKAGFIMDVTCKMLSM